MDQLNDSEELAAFQYIRFEDNFSLNNVKEGGKKGTTRLEKISDRFKTDLALFQENVRTSYSQRLPYSESLSIPFQVPDVVATNLVNELCDRFPDQVEYRNYEVSPSGHITAYWHPLTNQTIAKVLVHHLRGLRIRFL